MISVQRNERGRIWRPCEDMIISMTGFGRAETCRDGHNITVEIRSVNHRYLDISLHMPRIFTKFESDVRKILQRYLIRGKVDVNISYKVEGLSNTALHYNADFARQYIQYFEQMKEEFGIENDMTVSVMSKLPDVFTLEETPVDEEMVWDQIRETLENAAEKIRCAREAEGETLKQDILAKLDILWKDAGLVEERYPQIIEEYRSRLLAKLSEIKSDTTIDDARLASELVLYSDKLCTDEETVRLKSHIQTMQKALTEGGEVGRRLDFIAQEMNREANTILSKANDLKTSNIGIEMKTCIEKIREQIQNIE